jgi:hypothetical protein
MLSANSTVPWETPGLLLKTLLASDFPGATGQVKFNESDGDRIEYAILLFYFIILTLVYQLDMDLTF